MPTHRFPVLVCRGPDGTHAAMLVETPDEAPAVAGSAAAAVDQVRQYLTWSFDRRPWRGGPDFADAELSEVRVEVRPEYEHAGRRQPCPDTVWVAAPMVTGHDAAGGRLCSLPTVGVAFGYTDPATLRPLAASYLQARLRGLTPQQLSRLLPPAGAALEEVAVRVDADRAYRVPPPELPQLRATADAVGDRGFARRLSRPWERDAELDALAKLLAAEPVSVLLVGEAGSGKTALLVEAARRIEREGASPSAAGDADAAGDDEPAFRRRFWMTSAGRLIAGMQYLGQWEERVEAIIEELTEIDGWLCAGSLLDLVTTGGHGPPDSVAAFLGPYVERQEVRVVAEATPAELDACRRLLPGFAERFRLVRVPPMIRDRAVAALAKVADTHARNRRLTVTAGTVEQVHRLFARFQPYQAFPGAASAFLAPLLEQAARDGKRFVGPADVVDRFVRVTGLPELFVRDELPLDADALAAGLKARVIQQDEACEAAAAVITAFKAGMNDPGRPVGVLLFCGPTGVGKTELARAMAADLFGHGEQRDRMVRLDMSEYAGPGAADRLLTDAAGGPSELVAKVRQQPFNLLLLDEVEKASADVFDVLLGLFDEGRLTDRAGRLTTFRSCVVVMTSNLGAGTAGRFGIGPAGAAASAHAAGAGADADLSLSAVADFFRPEFVNRIDAVVPFRPLGPDAVRQITEKELGELARREGLARAGLALAWTPAVVDRLARTGFDPRYGARPLQRAIESAVVAPLARFMVAHPGLAGRTVTLDVGEGGALVLRAGDPGGGDPAR